MTKTAPKKIFPIFDLYSKSKEQMLSPKNVTLTYVLEMHIGYIHAQLKDIILIYHDTKLAD